MRKKYLLFFIFGLVLFFGGFLAKSVIAYEIDEDGNRINNSNVHTTTSSSNSTGEVNLPTYTSKIVTQKGVIDLNNTDVGGIFSALLTYILPLAGIILLFMLIMGGISLMTAAGNPDKIKAGSGRITMALVGFLIIFISYFIVQLVGLMLGVDLLVSN